jgi:hypothetical protein
VTPEAAIREIEEATSGLQVFSVLLQVFGSEYAQVLLHALAKVESLSASRLQERRK